jgi:acyl-coenzyme A thioesterase PaaI-like protein
MPELQPNSRHCFACGLANNYGLKLRFYNTAPGEVTVYYTVPEQFQGYPGIVHGGITTAILDEVTGRAQLGDDPNRLMFTAKLEIRFRKNVPVGKPLRIVGRMEKSKKRMASSVGIVYGPEGDLLVEAKALLVTLPEDVLKNEDMEALGWRVYDEDENIQEIGSEL